MKENCAQFFFWGLITELKFCTFSIIDSFTVFKMKGNRDQYSFYFWNWSVKQVQCCYTSRITIIVTFTD